MKKLENLTGAKALNRNEQKNINGGRNSANVPCGTAGGYVVPCGTPGATPPAQPSGDCFICN